MAIEGTIPQSQMAGVTQYSTQDPTSGISPGIIVPPSVLPILMATNTGLAPAPSAAPPHPQISQPLTAIPLGYQFAFNQLMSPTPYGNVITAYRIYRNKSSNNFSGSQLIRTIIHDPTHQGAVTVQDSTGGNVNYFYFVTAVDSTGQESNQPGSFQGSAVASGTANNVSQSTPTTMNPTTSSATYVVMPEMTITITTHGNKVLCTFNAYIQTPDFNSVTCSGSVALFRDGSQISQDIQYAFKNLAATNVNVNWPVSLSYLDAPTAASHTYDIRWRSITGQTFTNGALERALQVVELG